MDWSYIAGYFDGEGTITNSNKKTCKRFHIAITNTNLESLKEMQLYSNLGHIYKCKRRGKEYYKDTWVWLIQRNKEIIYFLEKIEPISIVKKDKAVFVKNHLLEREAQRKTPENLKVKLIEISRKGLSLIQMANELGIDRDTISTYLRIYGEYDNWLLTQDKNIQRICKDKIKFKNGKPRAHS